jgi:hypothetical protein
MNVKVVVKRVPVVAALALLLVASASGQFNSQVRVSNIIEGTGNAAGVSAARWH